MIPGFLRSTARWTASKKELAGAGERQEPKKLLPGFRGKRVLDLGRGYGPALRLCRRTWRGLCAGNGDLQKMLETARKRNPGPFLFTDPKKVTLFSIYSSSLK